jgi:hypothetical protein
MIVLRTMQLVMIIAWFGFLQLFNKPLFTRRESKTKIRHDLKEWDNNFPTKPLQIR